MALATYVLAVLRHADGTDLRLEVDFDDADAVADPDEQYGPLDPASGDLIHLRVVNTSTVTGQVKVTRAQGGGSNFWTIPCPPGVTQSPPGGGPVKNLNDITWQISSPIPGLGEG